MTDDGAAAAVGRAETGERSPRDGDRRRGIDRVILLLEALLRHGAPLRPADIARRLGAPRSTTYEIVGRLVEADLLEAAGSDGAVWFGRAMHLYGHAYWQHDAAHRRVAEALDRLAADAGATAQLCTLRGNKYIVFDSRDGPGPFRITSAIGAEVPIPWTASGRVLVWHLDREAIRSFIPPEDFRLPDGREIAVDGYLDEVERARELGYAETRGLADRFTHCLAAPIRDRDGLVRRTLCLVLPIDTPARRRLDLLTLLCERAQSLSSPA
jgi:DNA-binding IclR family transcriptional regulator